MKKFTITLTVIISSLMAFAQPGTAWDSLEYSGFGNSAQDIEAMATYQGTLYCAAYGSINNGGIYSSPTARFGSYVRDTGFDAVRDAADYGVMCLHSSSNGLFAGSENYSVGGQLYMFNGTTWTVVAPPVFSQPLYDYPQISGISAFNTGGVDSLYVFWMSNTNGLEIWKTALSNPGAGWTLALNMGGSPGLIVDDIRTFQGKLHVLFTDASLYSTADGITWTADNNVATGFGDAANIVKSIEVFNGDMYALCNNGTTGAQLWKSSDMLTWTPVMQDGFTNGTSLTSCADLHAAYGKLWINMLANFYAVYNSVKPQGSNVSVLGGGYGPLIYSTSDGSSFVRESEPSFGNVNNYWDWFLYSFSNKVLAAGYNNYKGASIYSKCLPPVASFTALQDTSCVFQYAFFNSTSTNADSLAWHLNATYYLSGPGFAVNYAATGVNTAMLIAHNASCVDTAYMNIEVYPPFVFDSIVPPGTPTVCENLTHNATVYFSGPPGPYAATWVSPFDTVTGLNADLPVPASVDYTVTVTNPFGCTAVANYYLFAGPSVNLGGTVTYSGGPVNGANVFAIKVGATSSQYDTVATVLTNASGVYSFTSLNAGNYIVRVEPDTSIYSNTFNTYYGDVYLWDSATVYAHYCDSNITQANVQLIELIPVTGPASITGVVYEGVGFGQKVIVGPGNPSPYTNVIPGVPVKVGKNPGGSIVASGVTDINGRYTFTDLPYDDYRIYTDIPGYPMDSSYTITLSAPNDSLVDLDYFVDSNSVYIDLTAAIHTTDQPTVMTLNLFPNPAKGFVNVMVRSDAAESFVAKITDLTGRTVSVLNYGTLPSGMNKISIDLSNGIVPGIYFIELKSGKQSYSGKLVIKE
jgi:hypothetical protein